ncbi:ABC transporter permease [Parafrankia discariae]|uniref:ABC transporter permease n=1 Tax=Parafrankia discariae TaxID=365528 RepID=UPI000366A830|nr:ABC transporter permease [Parafrankia discariae]
MNSQLTGRGAHRAITVPADGGGTTGATGATGSADATGSANTASPAGDVVFLGVIRSEWTKFRSLRSTGWTLALGGVAMVGLAVLMCATAAADWDGGDPELAGFDAAVHGLGGALLAQIAIGVLGVLVITGEYTTGMIRATLTLVPRRLPVLWAKAIVFAGVAFAFALVTSLVSFTVGQAILAGEDLDISIGSPGAMRAILGCAFFLTEVGLLGLAIGTLLRSTAGAVSALLAVLLGLPILMNLLPPGMQSVGRYLPASIGEVLISTRDGDNVFSPGPAAVMMTVYLVVALTAAAVVLARRDV